MDRRLAAVFIADLVGYVRLSQADEEGTRARFQTDLSEVFKPNIATHKGRLVKTMGDALLVEFHSVVDALRCATTAHGRRICSLNTMSHRNCPSPRSQTESGSPEPASIASKPPPMVKDRINDGFFNGIDPNRTFGTSSLRPLACQHPCQDRD